HLSSSACRNSLMLNGLTSFLLYGVLLSARTSCARKSRHRTSRSPGKVLGKFWDFSRKGQRAKMQAEQLLRFGPYRLDPGSEQLWRGPQEVKLTPKGLALLCLLVTRAGHVVTKEELFRSVWSDTVVSDDALTSCIQELRQALRDDARNPRYIETVHRRGYWFIGKVVSDQLSVVSRPEQATNEHESSSVMPAKAGIQEPQAPAAPESPWIPAEAGM